MENEVCCPVFDTSLWDGKINTWQDKLFMQEEICAFFHIPMGMGKVITKMCKQIEAAGAMPDPKDFLLLCHDPSPWRSQINMSVTKEVPGAKMVRMSGTFESKVFDGPYNRVPKWIKEMDQHLAAKGEKAQKYLFHYAYCPKCAKKYGHNYCVAFAQV